MPSDSTSGDALVDDSSSQTDAQSLDGTPLSDANTQADTFSDASLEGPFDTIADTAPDAPIDATGDTGPAWLGVCPPWQPTAFGAAAPAKGFPVPGRGCAKPGWPSPPGVAVPKWTDITAQVGLDKLGIVDSCLLWQDLTSDLVPDLLVVEQPGTPTSKRYARLYQQNGTNKWTMTSIALPASSLMIDCAPIDWNHDGLPEVAVASTSGVRLLASSLGLWQDVTASQVPNTAKGLLTWTLGVSDLDRDGDHDLYVGRTGQMNLQPGNYTCLPADFGYTQCCYGAVSVEGACLTKIKATPIATYTCCPPYELGAANLVLRNDKGQMTDSTVGSGAADPWASLVVAPDDIDRDGWPDLFVGNDFGPLGWYKNAGNLTFGYASSSLGMRPYGHTMGMALGDFDGDGHQDMSTGDVGPVTLYRGQPAGGWKNDNGAAGTWPPTQDMIGWAQLAADFDNDGWLDLLSAHSLQAKPDQLLQAMQVADATPFSVPGHHTLFHNQGKTFGEQQLPWPANQAPSIGPVAVAATDFDGDGDLDLAWTASPGLLRIFRNDSPPQHWLELELVVDQSALGGIGAVVQVWAQGYMQERSVQWTTGSLAHGDYARHFGLGSVTKLDQVVVWWPSGKVSMLGPQNADQVLTVFENQAQAKAEPVSGNDAGATDGGPDAGSDTADVPPLGGPGNSGIVPLALQNQPLANFTEITGQLGLDQGPAVTRKDCIVGADLDNDDRDDLLVVEQESVGPGKTVYRVRTLLNTKAGWQLKLSPIDGTQVIPALGCMAVDINADAHLDLLIGTLGSGMAVFQNNGEGLFEDKTASFLPLQEYDAWGGAFADFDHDGDIEIVVGAGNTNAECASVLCGFVPNDFWCTYATPIKATPDMQDQLFKRPNVLAKFGNATAAWKLPVGGEATEMMVLDVDRDGWVDLLVGNDFGDHYLLRNDKGKFVRFDKEIGFVPYALHMGWAVGDFNLDGLDDLVVADAGPSLLYIGKPAAAGLPAQFENQALAWGVAAATHDLVAWNPLVFDVDHDGFEDIWQPTSAIAPNGTLSDVGTCKTPAAAPQQRDVLLRNTGQGQFVALVGPVPKNQQQAFAATPAVALDIDDDGDLDIAEVRRGGTVHVLRNDMPPANSSVLVRLRTKVKNSAAIGAWMAATIDGKVHIRHQNGNSGYGGAGIWRSLFGLGKSSQISELTVHWPNGATSVHKALAAGSKVTLSEP